MSGISYLLPTFVLRKNHTIDRRWNRAITNINASSACAHVRAAASTMAGIPYQTLLNSELRQLMVPESATSNVSGEELRKIIREELDKTG